MINFRFNSQLQLTHKVFTFTLMTHSGRRVMILKDRLPFLP